MSKLSLVTISFILFYVNIRHIEGAKILAVFPTPSISHQVVFRKLTNELVRRGHEVTVITTDPVYSAGHTPSNLKEIDVHDISYKVWKHELSKATFGNKDDLYHQIMVIMRAIRKVFVLQTEVEEVQDVIHKRNGEYDLLLIEAWVKPALIFSHIYKIPVIHISSLGPLDFNSRIVGASTHPILYPSQIHKKLYNLTMWNKIQELWNHIWFDFLWYKMEQEDDESLQAIFGPDTPKIEKLYDNVDMLFVNMHPIWLDNQPVPTSMVYIGGIHTSPPKKLPKDLETYLNSSRNGVIYFSLGTNVDPSLLPPEKLQLFAKVLSQLPYDIIWKWDKDELPGNATNIKFYKWLPQSSLLYHPKVKLFITQGGMQSTDEAISAGVPLIGIPMLGDQWYNVEKYVRHKIGLRLDVENLSEIEFKNAILTVTNDTSYRENVIRLRTIINDQPNSALERAVWWTEHILRHGGAKHLRAAGANISWAEYLELDLVFIVCAVVTSVVSVVLILLSFLWNLWKISEPKIKIKIK